MVCVCFSVHVPCVFRCPWRQEWGLTSTRSEVTNGSKSPHGFWELDLGPLLLTAEPMSLAPKVSPLRGSSGASAMVQC